MSVDSSLRKIGNEKRYRAKYERRSVYFISKETTLKSRKKYKNGISSYDTRKVSD